MKRTLFAAVVAILLGGCHADYPPLETVKKVDLERYLGQWYEIARFEQRFQEGCMNVTATYSLNDDGTIKVLNRCDTLEEQNKSATGVAYAVDETNAKLKVSFFRPFYGDYWILDLDENYTYAVVGEQSRNYLWILARTSTLAPELLESIIAKIAALGFDTSKLLFTKHRP